MREETMDEKQWYNILEKDQYSFARLILFLIGSMHEDGVINSAFLYEFSPDVGDEQCDCFDVGALGVGEVITFKLIRLLYFAYSRGKIELFFSFKSDKIFQELYEALSILHNTIKYLKQYESGKIKSSTKDEDIARIDKRRIETFSEAFSLFGELDNVFISPYELVSFLQNTAEGRGFIPIELQKAFKNYQCSMEQNLHENKKEEIPQKVIAEYKEKAKLLGIGDGKCLTAYLYNAQGMRIEDIQKALGWTGAANNTSRNIGNGKKIAEEQGLPPLSK